jgi:hypothetical protein
MLFCLRICILLILATLGSCALFAQSCPSSDGKSFDAPQLSVLHGTIKYHPGTRPWLGLVLEKPVCGASEIELAFGRRDGWSRAKQMDHCSVTVKGVISESVTVYYSADLNIFNPVITADSDCRLLPADPDYEKMTIPDSVKSYEVTVFTDIRENKPLRGEVSASGQRLEPWRAYVEIFLNGEEDLNLSCRKGFRLISFKSTKGTSELFDPNTARLNAEDGSPGSLTIVCHRE